MYLNQTGTPPKHTKKFTHDRDTLSVIMSLCRNGNRLNPAPLSTVTFNGSYRKHLVALCYFIWRLYHWNISLQLVQQSYIIEERQTQSVEIQVVVWSVTAFSYPFQSYWPSSSNLCEPFFLLYMSWERSLSLWKEINAELISVCGNWLFHWNFLSMP